MRGFIVVLTIQISLPGCNSLKQKRSFLKSLLSRLHRQFNISAAEVDWLDDRDCSVIACACISNESNHSRQVLLNVVQFIKENYPDSEILEDHLETI